MLEWIASHIGETLFTLISGGIIVWCKDLSKKIKERKAEQEALKSGLLAILHDRLFSICYYAKIKQCLTLGILESQTVFNFKIDYESL